MISSLIFSCLRVVSLRVGLLLAYATMYLVATLFSSSAFASQQDPVEDADFGFAAGGYVQPYKAKVALDGYIELVAYSYWVAHKEALQMQRMIVKLLAAPSEETLAEARFAWINARTAYLQTEAFRFYEGPIDHGPDADGEEGPEGRINAWPINEAVIDYVAGNPGAGLINDLSVALNIDEIVARDQVTDEADVTTGWHAIEFLLWGQDLSLASAGMRPSSDYDGWSEVNKRRRQYLSAVTTLLVDDLGQLAKDWDRDDSGSYAAVFAEYSQEEALSRILTSLATLAGFEMGNERLAAGLDSGDQEDEHSCFSDTTHNDFVYDLRGISNIYFGDDGGRDFVGLNELVASLAPQLDRRMMRLLNQAEDALMAMPLPYDTILASAPDSASRGKAEAAFEALLELSLGFEQLGALFGVKVISPTE